MIILNFNKLNDSLNPTLYYNVFSIAVQKTMGWHITCVWLNSSDYCYSFELIHYTVFNIKYFDIKKQLNCQFKIINYLPESN